MGQSKAFLILVASAITLLSFGNQNASTAGEPDRTVAWHRAIVTMNTQKTNIGILTYAPGMQYFLLGKVVPGVVVDGAIKTGQNAMEIQVQEFPGKIVCSYHLAGCSVTTEVIPLAIGRDNPDPEGAVLVHIATQPRVESVLKIGEILISDWGTLRQASLANDSLGCMGAASEVNEGIGILTSKQHPFVVSVSSSGTCVSATGEAGDQQTLTCVMPTGEGTVVMGFAKDRARAMVLAHTDPERAREEAEANFNKLLESRIQTPEASLDLAFRSALLTLEYNWVDPYGWIECVRHWPGMWHMQASAGASWIGQSDRARKDLLTLAEKQLPNGGAPQLTPYGEVHREVFTSGSDQFYTWQIDHYWNYTADTETATILYPVLKKVVQHSYKEFDRDGDLLLKWGPQIGNQEDFIHTPYNGTTPSIEGIQMLRTASRLAAALGNVVVSASYEARATAAERQLRSDLWQPNLGRFMYYKDPLGFGRPDGQYHTLLYPVIYGLLDPLDSWTSIRHLRDRLMGENGEVYCSNNFPTHSVCTSGVQAGAAQQPWAAKGLAAIGLRNEAYWPLKAVAQWVMNPDHKGAWMEVANEPVAAHFSPPAGLYVQSVIEALFGLKARKPNGDLHVSPSFPDIWPMASLTLPDYSADFKREGSTLIYSVKSRDSLRRLIRWSLPVCSVESFRINGSETPFALSPGVGCVILSATTNPEVSTKIEIKTQSHEYHIESPASIAEGDTIEIRLDGLTVKEMDDRCGVLSSISIGKDGIVKGTVREGQIEPYLSFGRLGLLNFSKRSFFLFCTTHRGCSFWAPVDMTVLPRYEVMVEEKGGQSPNDQTLPILVRNNTLSSLHGPAMVRAAGSEHPFTIDIPPRSEKVFPVAIDESQLKSLSPGENQGFISLPCGVQLQFTFIAPSVTSTLSEKGKSYADRIVPIPLPEGLLKNDLDPQGVRNFYPYDWLGWDKFAPNLSSLVGQTTMTLPEIPGLQFQVKEQKIIPVSWKTCSPSITLDLFGNDFKKIYLLVIPYLDNHDSFVKVASLSVRTEEGTIYNRDLFSPGDLDWGAGEKMANLNRTWSQPEPRTGRFSLLPLLPPDSGEWKQGKPPAFPQPDYWATCLVHRIPSATLNVIELDLGEAQPLASITITTSGVDPAIGLVAVSAEMSADDPLLTAVGGGDRSLLFRPARNLFELNQQCNLEGWRVEGQCFSVAASPGLFDSPTLNSLVAAGEAATGKAISPDFEINNRYLTFQLQGGLSGTDSNILILSLVDSTSGEILQSVKPSGSHVPQKAKMSVAQFLGRKVHLELVDENRNPTLAWIGLSHITLSPR